MIELYICLYCREFIEGHETWLEHLQGNHPQVKAQAFADGVEQQDVNIRVYGGFGSMSLSGESDPETIEPTRPKRS